MSDDNSLYDILEARSRLFYPIITSLSLKKFREKVATFDSEKLDTMYALVRTHFDRTGDSMLFCDMTTHGGMASFSFDLQRILLTFANIFAGDDDVFEYL